MALALSNAGARVDTARSGTDAGIVSDSCRRLSCICDAAESGLELLERILQIDAAAGRFTPAIAVSAPCRADHRAACAQIQLSPGHSSQTRSHGCGRARRTIRREDGRQRFSMLTAATACR